MSVTRVLKAWANPRAAVVALAMLAGGVLPALAEYRLQTGDVVELTVIGLPDVRQRSTVATDGTAWVPLLGSINAGGLTLQELTEKVKQMVPFKELRQRSPDGRENSFIIDPQTISVTIAEYRPVYVSGDVARPGEQPYRPGMIVRQAVAVAGGIDMVRFRYGTNPFVQAADLRTEFENLRADLVREQVRIARLKTELDNKPSIDFNKLGDTLQAPAEQLKAMSDLEQEQFDARAAVQAREKASLQRSIEHAQEQLEALTQQQQSEETGLNQQTEDVQRIRALFDKGQTTAQRLLEEQRSLLLSKSRLLSTVAQRAAAQRTVDESRRQLERLDEVRRTDILRELTEATLSVDKIRSRLQGASEKFSIIDSGKANLGQGQGRDIDIALYRKQNGKDVRMAATGEEALQPGDVVEVSLRPNHILGLAYN